MKALVLCCLAAALVPLARAETDEAWQLQPRCVAQVCVGDTLYTARQRLPAGWRLRESAGRADWRDPSGALAARFVLEDEPAPRAEARRIALIEVHRAGTGTGVNGLKLGDAAAGLVPGAGGEWAQPENGLRWWLAQRPQASGSDNYPLNLGVNEQDRVVQAVLNGKRLRETSFQRLADALAASRQRLQALDAKSAAVPEVPAAAQPPGAVHADLEWLPKLLTLRFTSRLDCSVASCEILRVEVGGRALGANDGPRVKLPGGEGARFLPTRCGGSCTAASIAFLRQGQPVRLQFDATFGRPGATLSAAQEQALLAAMASSTLH
ncbi:hypothetical protein BurJ1DRAFT_0807 [Burkholderiales bacterium JOSHI_001]|nr:hypothetical protein BurJ1DRAFT_0807 [Burkholderiales bacterium JOSHI_001]